MKVSKLRQQLQCLSGRHAAIVDIDTIVAYLVFVSVIIFLVNYVLGLTAPFSTSIDALSKEEGTVLVKDLVSTEFKTGEFNKSCNINYSNVRRFATSYIIEGFRMPSIDEEFINPNNFNGSVVFNRNGNILRVIIGSQSVEKIITVELIIPTGASITNVSLDNGDSFEAIYNEFGDFKITLNSNVSNGDTDEIIINPVTDDIVTFTIEGLSDLTDSYVGNVNISDTCGVRGLVGRHTSFNKYGSLSNDRESYPIRIMGDVWWIG